MIEYTMIFWLAIPASFLLGVFGSWLFVKWRSREKFKDLWNGRKGSGLYFIRDNKKCKF